MPFAARSLVSPFFPPQKILKNKFWETCFFYFIYYFFLIQKLLTFLCSSNIWSAVCFSFLNCSSRAFSRCCISARRSMPWFFNNSLWAKFQSTVSPLLGVSAGDSFFSFSEITARRLLREKITFSHTKRFSLTKDLSYKRFRHQII